MSIDGGVDKEAVVHTHSGILLSHEKVLIWVSSNKVDEPKASYTEWSELEKDKYHILMHIYGI